MSRKASVEMALDRYNCYPTETVRLFLNVGSMKESGSVLFVKIPQMAEIVPSEGDVGEWFRFRNDESGTILYTKIPVSDTKPQTFSLLVQPGPLYMDHYLMFSAWVEDRSSDIKGVPSNASKIRLAVKSQAKYLDYLPELYSSDDFMNRYMMFFESFWKPINTQIGQNENYFDPELTTESLLPWLGSWLGLEIDDSFPKEKRRKLLKTAVSFYHCRGTLKSLILFLEMYSGGKVTVHELKAKNMALGKDALLGEGIALGKENKPNTVSITLTASRNELSRTGFSEEVYTQKIKHFVRKIVPAHTVFTVNCRFTNPLKILEE